MKKIPFLRPNLVKHETLTDYLKEIDNSRIYSNFGPLNSQFEKRVLKDYFDDCGDVTTVNNATIGLMLAISQSKLPKGKYAIMPSFTFAATPLAAIWCGLEPLFVDIRPDDWCMDENVVQELLHKHGEDVAVVVPYATFGNPMNLDYYRYIHENGTPVVVDAAASFGVTEAQNQFGKGFPGAVVFSFHATKSFGVGEGGLIYSNNKNFISKVRQAENFGFSKNRESTQTGLNGKMSEYTVAVALSTLDNFDKKIKTRQQIYHWYLEELNRGNLLEKGWLVQNTKGSIPYQFMPICCPEGQQNTEIIRFLGSQNIEARTYFSPPCHNQPLFQKYSHTPLPVTERISNQILSLPLWEEMTNDDVCTVVERLGLS
ncbi:aminotransferase class I/II-fold pyridoxal phosphate-dependent enzyme [Bacillus sp. BGMRC 2118]|nr:aminotransferase class I/II-fold pyridoxal phosphate-dependent enzyme [Bacillus sp. BGMRC 2118]